VPFRCPECSHSSLKIERRIELPPDSRSDEIALQIVTCSQCGFAGIAVYEESRRGALDSESVDHRAYRTTPADLKIIRQAIRACPKPRDNRCRCASHRRLGRKDASGRWSGLADVHLEGRFNLIFGKRQT
jgi:hypothetical protein